MVQVQLDQDDLKAIEQTRQRLFQLTNNIASLKQDVLRNNPLPPWLVFTLRACPSNANSTSRSSLQTSSSILAQNIQSLTTHLSKHADLLSRTVAYPSTNYPGREQEGLLAQLLRKKIEPQVESWVEGGRAVGNNESGSYDEEFWSWVTSWIGDRVAKYAIEEAGDNYTVEERERGIENVNTGLRRKLDEDVSSEEEDEDEDVEMSIGAEKIPAIASTRHIATDVRTDGRPRTMQEILRLATSGVVVDGNVGPKR